MTDLSKPDLSPSMYYPADFNVEDERDPNSPFPSKRRKVTRCWCGWSTTALDRSLYGQENALQLALLSHRLDHSEGRIEAAR